MKKNRLRRWLSILLAAAMLTTGSAYDFSGIVKAEEPDYETDHEVEGTTVSENGLPDVDETSEDDITEDEDLLEEPKLIQDADKSSGVYYNAGSSMGMTDFRDETIYFVMTARFYDGDSSNNVQCWDAQDLNVNDPPWRGDFKGLIEKLDYIKALGFTAVWITPVVENASGYDYHGYHAINFSKVEPRLESGDDYTYEDLIEAVHERGMKIIQDVVFNHTGNWGESNLLPLASKNYTADQSDCEATMKINDFYKWDEVAQSFGESDYASAIPKNQFETRVKLLGDGAYDTENIYHHDGGLKSWETYDEQVKNIAGDCIDLNTENPKVYHYLVDAYSQYIEMGVDAFRVDTVKHISRLTFNNALLAPLNEAYNQVHGTTGEGNFYMFGEVCTRVRQVWNKGDKPCLSCPFYTWKERADYDWDDSETLAAAATNRKSVDKHFIDNGSLNNEPTSNNAKLNGNEYHATDYSKASGLNVIDFPMHWNFQHARDAFRVAVDNDQYYNDATFNVTYVDSHDYAPDGAPENQRFAGTTGDWAENLSLMFTFRGIPCIYYGSEVEFQKGKTIDPGTTMPLKDTGRAYFGDYIEGSVNVTDFGRYSGASGAMAETLNNPLSLHIQRLNRLRACIPALRKGQYSTEGCSGGMSFKRRYTDANTDSFVLVAISNNATFSNVPGGKYVDAITGDTQTVAEGGTLTTSGIKGQGDLRVYVLDTGDKTPYLGMIDGKSQFMSGGTDTVAATSPVEREHGGNESIPATGITLDKSSAALDLGETVKLTATIAPSDATNKRVTWSTSDDNVAKVNGGTVTAVDEGIATITAKTSNGITADATITVRASGTKVESVTISPKTKTLNAGETFQLTASVSPAGADPKYAALTWKSSAADVASVDSNGLVTAKKQGTATITASTAYFGKSDTAVITVKGPKFTFLDGDAVYFEKPAGWGSEVKAYFWTGTGEWKNAAFPGVPMTLLNESAGIYGIQWPQGKSESELNVLFTDKVTDTDTSGHQTADLLGKDGKVKINGYYDASGLVKVVDPNEGGDDDDPIEINSFKANPASSSTKGSSVSLTAVATGGTGALEYKFTAQLENGSESTIRDYGTTSTTTWTPQTAGRYTLKVYVKDSGKMSGEGTIANYEVRDNVVGDINITGFTANPSSSVNKGSSVSLTAAATGGTGTLEYKFAAQLQNGSESTIRDYGTSATATWTPQTAGTYTLKVYVKDSGNKSGTKTIANYEVKDNVPVDIQISFKDETKKYVYNGQEQKPEVIVKDGTKTLAEGTDYSLSYENCFNAGSKNLQNAPTVIVKGQGAYLREIINVKLTFTIEQAEIPEGAPESTMMAAAGPVKDLALNAGWEWSADSKNMVLEKSETISVSAVYNGTDKANYKTTTVWISLTGISCEHPDSERETIVAVAPTCLQSGQKRIRCKQCHKTIEDGENIPPTGHRGGTATCSSQATCVNCGEKYGSYDDDNHANIVIQNKKEANCQQEGYTGDLVCEEDNRHRISTGNTIPKTSHSWDAGKVTKAATATEDGIRTFTCAKCGQTKTETIPKTGGGSTLKAGDSVTDTASKGNYKVTQADSNVKTVEFVSPAAASKTVSIPNTIVVNGTTYQVTSIAANAFKNNKTVTSIKMGSNIKTIGSNAFSGCSQLKKVTLSKNTTAIGSKAFYKCTKLTSITIPAKVSKIGSKAFYGCKNLKKITIKTTKLTSKKVGSQAFKGIAAKATIKVPKQKLTAYKKFLKKKGVGSKVKIKK